MDYDEFGRIKSRIVYVLLYSSLDFEFETQLGADHMREPIVDLTMDLGERGCP
jgi:hypothetical protein